MLLKQRSHQSLLPPRSLTPRSSGRASVNVQKAKEPASPSISRKSSPFSMKERSRRTDLHAFKSKGTTSTKKKQPEAPSPFESGLGLNRELKPRIFFIERNEPADEEVLHNIGNDILWFRANPDYTASDTKERQKRLENEYDDGTGIPRPIFYMGKLRNRLSDSLKKGSQSMGTTQYLGKMTYLKDKHGLYSEQPNQLIDDNVQDIKYVQDNPIFLALDKVKVRQQLSVDSGPRSRGVSIGL